MATRALAPADPIGAILAAVAFLSPAECERLAEAAIDRIDGLSPDPDLEEGGDLEGIDDREPDYEDGHAAAEGMDQRHILHHGASLYVMDRDGP